MEKRGNEGEKGMEQGGHIILTQEEMERILRKVEILRELESSRMSAGRAVVGEQKRLTGEEAVEQSSEPRVLQEDEIDVLQRDTAEEAFLNGAETAFWIIFILLALFCSASFVFTFVLGFAFLALIFVASIKIADGIGALMSRIWRNIRRR